MEKKKGKESYTKSTGAFPYWKDQQPHQWPIPQPSSFFIVESSAIRPEDKSSLRKRNNSFHQLAGRMHRRLRSVHKNWSRGIECYSVRCPAWRTFPTRLPNAHQVYRCTTRWKGPIDEFLRDAFWVNTPVHMKSACSRFFFSYIWNCKFERLGTVKTGGGGRSVRPSFLRRKTRNTYIIW